MKDAPTMHDAALAPLLALLNAEFAPPILAVYGSSPRFVEIVSDAQEYLRLEAQRLYIALDLEKEAYHSAEDALFGLMRQTLDMLIETVRADVNAQARLLAAFRELWSARSRVGQASSAEQLAEFVQFSEYVCYPILREVLGTRPRLLCGLIHLEKAANWATLIHHFMLEQMRLALTGVELRFIVFMQSATVPNLFYGSNEESANAVVRCVELDS